MHRREVTSASYRGLPRRAFNATWHDVEGRPQIHSQYREGHGRRGARHNELPRDRENSPRAAAVSAVMLIRLEHTLRQLRADAATMIKDVDQVAGGAGMTGRSYMDA
jgi:hypothetical protein